ncbi:ParA family protein [Romboutsia sp. Marseille-P6047]|uniref:ParA family protein n=1 Tax=Romboutsia sp. Marseille-P6047 TaxID=2161817 RepID=UPI000F04AACD|nr:AAA family ATPase [Romboutsia sp. Marseille-P6047]
MKLIANFNIKGGVGKTALNILTGIRLAQEGNKILFIDADSQSNLTEYFFDVNHKDKTIADALLKQEPAENVILKGANEKHPNIDLIPSTIDICTLSEDISNFRAREMVVARWMKSNINILNQYDYIIVDLSPSMELINRNFLYLMDSIIFLIEHGDVSSLRGIQKFNKEYMKDLNELEIEDSTKKATLINSFKTGNRSIINYFNEQLEIYKSLNIGAFLEDSLLDTVINESDVIKRALLEQEDLRNIDKRYRNKKVEQQFESFIEELKQKEIL